SDERFIPLPDPSFDESFHFVDDVEALRLSGDLETIPVISAEGEWVADWTTDAVNRQAANALTYASEDGQPVDASNVPPAAWKVISKAGVPGTARRFVVHHPDSTDPALATEVLVAYEVKDPDLDSWYVMLVTA